MNGSDREAIKTPPPRAVCGRELSEFLTEATPSGLLPAEDALLASISKGDLCWSEQLYEGQAWPFDKPDKERPGKDARVRAEFVRLLALGSDPACAVHEKGIKLAGVFIEGVLDLSYCDVRCSLQFSNCWFEKSLILRGARIVGLELVGCRVPGIDARAASFVGGIDLSWGSRCDGGIWLHEAKIGGSLSCEASRIAIDSNGRSIIAQSTEIGGNVYLRSGFLADGQIWLQGCTIGGDLDCGSGRFQVKAKNDARAKNGPGIAIIARYAKIGGNVLMNNGFEAAGGAWLRGLEIGGDLSCEGGSFHGRTADGQGIALDITSAKIKGNVNFGDGFRATGEVSLHSCEVGGSVECGGLRAHLQSAGPTTNATRIASRFVNHRGIKHIAFNATSAKIKGNLLLLPGVRVLGSWTMVGAEIGGHFQCDGSRFLNRTRDGQGIAFSAANAKAKYVELRNGVRVLGQATFRGVEIDGDLDCPGIQVANRADLGEFKGAGIAFDAQLAKIKGDLRLSDGRLAGQTILSNVEINGDLDCSRSHFVNPTSDGQGTALNAGNADIKGSAHLSGIEASGKVALMGASISGQLACDGSRFSNAAPAMHQGRKRRHNDLQKAEVALDLQDIEVGDTLFLGPPGNFPDAHLTVHGSLSLSSAHTRVFSDHHDSWPPHEIPGPGGALQTEINLDGFTYDRLDSDLTPVSLRKKWLRQRVPDAIGKLYSPQPFEQLAKVFRTMGREDDARIIAQDKQAWRREEREAPRVWGLYGFFVGYGYRPGRLIKFMVGLWLICALVYWQAWRTHLFVPAQPAVLLSKDLATYCQPPDGNWNSSACASRMTGYPSFNAFVYSLEHSLPVLDLQQKRSWVPASSDTTSHFSELVGLGPKLPDAPILWAVVWVQTALGWLGGLVLAAVLSGIVKKD